MSNCSVPGKMINIYEAEGLIKEILGPLFPEDMVFTQFKVDELDSTLFNDIDDVDDRIAALITYGGFSVPDGAVRSNTQVITPIWRIHVVTPSELYKSHAGGKLIEVIRALKGYKLYPDSGKELKLLTDVREFNEVEFVNNMVAIPSVFAFDVTI